MLRHVKGGLHLHITFAVIVLIIVAVVGLRLWGIHVAHRPLKPGS